MPNVSMQGLRMGRGPAQAVFIGPDLSPGLVCASISEGTQGTTAAFEAPGLMFRDDKSLVFTNELTVYADQYGEGPGMPMFRGVVDNTSSRLRGETVVFKAASIYSHLRRRSTAIRETLSYTDGVTRTFTAAGLYRFLEINPYIKSSRVFNNWTPGSILKYFLDHFLEVWFKERLTFLIDPQADMLQPYDVPVFKWELVADKPELVATLHQKSALGDQVFRLSTWGQLIDFIASLMPGVQVYEVFSDTGSIVYFGQPFYNGFIQGTLGHSNLPWQDVGANVEDLEEQIDSGGTVNRFIASGDPALCTVSLFSETEDAEGNLIGLIPDWKIFDFLQEPGILAEPDFVQGASAFDYEAGTYSAVSVVPTSLSFVLNHPEHCYPSSPTFIPRYEKVGRSWRLPNWFSFAEVASGNDMFTDPLSGDQVNVQIFVEKAIASEDGTNFYYKWFPFYGNVRFDWKRKSFEMEYMEYTHFLRDKEDSDGLSEIDPDKGWKLCRVCATFTYGISNFVPYADTLMQSAGVIEPARLTGIGPGQPMLFERPDLSFAQITNINMPLNMKYSERLTMPSGMDDQHGILQALLEVPVSVVYAEFMVATHADGVSAVSTYRPMYPRGQFDHEAFLVPMVIKDDTTHLHKLVNDLLMWRGKRARSYKCTFGGLVKAARRGMMAVFANLDGYENDWDCVDFVHHDLIQGRTAFNTTNGPGSTLDIMTVARDTDTDG